jgi:hypothetical protein
MRCDIKISAIADTPNGDAAGSFQVLCIDNN